MIRLTHSVVITAAACCIAIAGCEKKEASGPSASSTQETGGVAEPLDDGKVSVSRSLEIGETGLSVSASGSATPNAEINLEIHHESGPVPEAIRLWFGPRSGEGSLKTRADGHDDHWHGHVECPGTITSQDALWIEVEDSEGNRVARSIKVT